MAVVPLPPTDSMSKLPPNAFIRLRILIRPNFVEVAFVAMK